MRPGVTLMMMALTWLAPTLLGELPASAWGAGANPGAGAGVAGAAGLAGGGRPPVHVPWVVRHELNRDEATLRRDSARLSPDIEVLRGADVVVLRVPVRLLFDPDSDQLRPALRAAEMLALPITLLRQRRRLVTRIDVYSDNIGGQQLNADLSGRRAMALANALLSAGIAMRRVQALGRGMAQGLAGNDTAQGRMLNRRVEFTFARTAAAASAGTTPVPATGPADG